MDPDEEDSNPFRYCGEYYDKETGTIYLRARYYNPSIGRFFSEDIIVYIREIETIVMVIMDINKDIMVNHKLDDDGLGRWYHIREEMLLKEIPEFPEKLKREFRELLGGSSPIGITK